MPTDGGNELGYVMTNWPQEKLIKDAILNTHTQIGLHTQRFFNTHPKNSFILYVSEKSYYVPLRLNKLSALPLRPHKHISIPCPLCAEQTEQTCEEIAR